MPGFKPTNCGTSCPNSRCVVALRGPETSEIARQLLAELDVVAEKSERNRKKRIADPRRLFSVAVVLEHLLILSAQFRRVSFRGLSGMIHRRSRTFSPCRKILSEQFFSLGNPASMVFSGCIDDLQF